MTTAVDPRTAEALSPAEWQSAAAAHADRADELTALWREWHGQGRKHPIEDFLFTYYPFRPAVLRRWSPGVGVALLDAATDERADWPFSAVDPETGALTVDAAAFLAKHGRAVQGIEAIIAGALRRPAHFGCFGMHEWAMQYRVPPEQRRHGSLQLRLGQDGTDRVVESHRIQCSHFDAFRFFTPEAVGRNVLQPSRDTQAAMEQPGCLHAGMDLYKWAMKLGPLVPGELRLDCFELARDIRWLDMRASPYDTRPLGAEPVAVETAAGKAEYLEAQEGFSQRAQALRVRLLDVIQTARRLAEQAG